MSAFDDEEYESFDLTDDDLDDPDSLEEAGDLAGAGGGVGGDDEDDFDPDDDDPDDDDDPEDAAEEEIDFVLAAYSEEGQPSVTALQKDVANDLEELIHQLRRLPAEAGAIGFVSIDTDVFVVTRIRGQHVQVLLSDGSMASEWPIARDVVDLLGLDAIPDEDEIDPVGDLGIFADLGVGEIDMARFCDEDADTDQILIDIAGRLGLTGFRRVAEAELGD